MLSKLLALVAREPAAVVAIVDAVLVVGVTFGLHLGTDQTAAIDGLLVLVAGIVTRSQVSPVAPSTPAVTITGSPAA